MKDMNEKEILRHVDHTLLSQEAVWDEIRQVCDDAVKYDTASVCIPPSYVKQAAEYVGGRVPICTVIGFPNGYETTAVKEFETKDAIANGADEIDMVINIGWLKDRKYDQIEEEIRILKNACGSKVLKVIIETCLLTDECVRSSLVRERIILKRPQVFQKQARLLTISACLRIMSAVT